MKRHVYSITIRYILILCSNLCLHLPGSIYSGSETKITFVTVFFYVDFPYQISWIPVPLLWCWSLVLCDLCLRYLFEAIDCRLWLRQYVSGLLQRSPGFEFVPVHVGFILDRMALEQVLLQVLQLSSDCIVLQILHFAPTPFIHAVLMLYILTKW